MKIFRFLLSERKINGWRAAVAAALFVVLFAAAAQCDEIEDSLPPDTPQGVKASARQAIQNGLPPKDIVKLTRAMLQNKFDEQQVQLAHTLMIKAQNSSMPVQPLMNKAFEGMAKNVPPPLIISAMERVQSRNEFAYSARGAAHQSEKPNGKPGTHAGGRPCSRFFKGGRGQDHENCPATRPLHEFRQGLQPGPGVL